MSEFPPRKILVAVDGSENSERASKAAIALAKLSHAELMVISVVAPVVMVGFPSIGADPYPTGLQPYYDDAGKNGAKIVEGVVSQAKNAGVVATGYVERSPSSIVQTIVDKAASEKVDLIVVGTRGLGGFKKLLLGSVSSGVISHAETNVLVVR